MDSSRQHYPTSTSSDETEEDVHLYDHISSNAAASASRKRSFGAMGKGSSTDMNTLSMNGQRRQPQQLGGGGGESVMWGNTSTSAVTGNQHQQQTQSQLQQQQQQQQRKYSGPSPSLRKEQNRAAQRAFRDRKERYVHQLEGMVKEQKEQFIKVTNRLQADVSLLKERNAVLQSENHYLREVIFAFETSLSKGAALGKDAGIAGLHRAMLQSVKEELFTRHHAKKAQLAAEDAAKKLASASMPSPKSEDGVTVEEPSSGTPSRTVTASDKAVIDSGSNGGGSDDGLGRRGPQSVSSPKRTSEDAQGPCSPPKRSNSIGSASDYDNSTPQLSQGQEGQDPNQVRTPSSEPPGETLITGPTSEVLYKAPPLFIGPGADHGPAMLISPPFESITVPNLLAPKSSYPNVTRYPNYPTVFDELQSSLFPPGTLRSLVHENMASPREVVEDNSLFDQKPAHFLQKETKSTRQTPGKRPQQRPVLDPKARAQDPRSRFIGESNRLRKELEILMSAPPPTDPQIDPKIFEIPHDPWIDIMPCAQMRAQLILHRDKYNSAELWSILQNGAFCHGDPLDIHAWELPDIVFTKYAFLWGQSAERHRMKVWPRKFAPTT